MRHDPDAPTPEDVRIVVGSPVTGGDFFGRQRELEDFTDAIRGGAHVLLTAPRRIGKTSLLMEAAKRLSGDHTCLYVDVQACTSEADAIVKLATVARDVRDLGQVVYDTFRNVLGSVLDHIAEVGVSEFTLKLQEGTAADWRGKGDELVDRLAQTDRPVVLCFDELPVLVSALLMGSDLRMTPEKQARTRVFLSWLREVTIRQRGRLRVVVCGSIGLEPLLSWAGLSETATTFMPFELPPWDNDTALEFLRDRGRRARIEFVGGADQRLLDLLGQYVPHHVQMFMYFVYLACKRRQPRQCASADIDELYRTKMLSVHGHVELATYEDRLKRILGPERLATALELLTEAAMAGRLTPPAALHIVRSHLRGDEDPMAELRFLLGLFTHDGYLKSAGPEHVFVSGLLRDWWKNRFGFGYVVVHDRSQEIGR